MRVIAILCWYEEPPSWLATLVSSLTGLVDHLVAVDGAYELFPGSGRKPVSGAEQAETILGTATALKIGCTIYRPGRSFAGNEVEKRSQAFRLAAAIAEPGVDWLLVLDADEIISAGQPDLIRHELAQVAENVATVDFWQRHVGQPLPGQPGITYPGSLESAQRARRFFRADPTLRVEGAHYVYVTGPASAPRYLWGHERFHDLEPAAHVGLRVEHLQEFRGEGRRRLQTTYYEVRDRIHLETPEPVRV